MRSTGFFRSLALLMPLIWPGGDSVPETTVEQLRWIPNGARLVMVFNQPSHHQDVHASLGAAIVFATGTDGALKQFSEITGVEPLREAERLVIARLTGKDRRDETVAIAKQNANRIVSRSLVKDNFRIEVLDEEHLLFGGASSVELAKVLFEGLGNQSILQNPQMIRVIRHHEPGFQIWGAAMPEWLENRCRESDLAAADIEGNCVCRSLSGIQAISFSANAMEEAVAFRMKTETKDAASSEILADALRGLLTSLRRTAKSSAPPEVQEFLNGAQVRTDQASIDLEMALSAPALERIRANESTKALLQWQLGDAGREAYQNIREIIGLLDLPKGSRVADVGSGLGFFTVRLARAVGLQGRVYAVDIDPDLVQQLRWRVREAPFPQVEVILGQPEDPLLPVGQLDAVLVVNSYHEMPQHQLMLQHIRAALKPGGRLLITEPAAGAQRTESRAIQERNHMIAPELAEQDLLREGFEILARNDDFIQYPDAGRQDWLILARRPRNPATPDDKIP
jgi:protein-L-isoaspartate O-methyltransferase